MQKKQTSRRRAPRARPCFVCGREVLLAGYEYHIQKCSELFEKREELKPIKERRKLPHASLPVHNMQTPGNICEFNVMKGARNSAIEKSSTLKFDEYLSTNASFTPAEMQQCPDCGRTFCEVAFPKHVRICRKVFIMKRKVYNSSKVRMQGTDFANYQRSQNKVPPTNV